MYDVIIIGSGPAGLTAAIYCIRASLKTLNIAGYKWGGQLMLTTLVENFPGFPKGVQGPELMQNMRSQAENLGVEFIDRDATEIIIDKKPFTVRVEDREYSTKSIILATGADTKWLGVPGEQELIGRGVSTCAPCDAFFFRNKNVAVVGGGDSAMEEASVLSQVASSVIIIYRGSQFRASKVMQDRVLANPKIKVVWNTNVLEIIGTERVSGLKLKNDIKEWEMPIDGVFVAIGHKQNTELFAGKTLPKGVFIGGDVADQRYMQAVTAAGYGCMAALDVQRYLEDNK